MNYRVPILRMRGDIQNRVNVQVKSCVCAQFWAPADSGSSIAPYRLLGGGVAELIRDELKRIKVPSIKSHTIL